MANREYQVKLVYNWITVQVARSAEVVRPKPRAVSNQNRSFGRKTETIFWYAEEEVTVTWTGLTLNELSALYTYWKDWGAQGKQAALTLDVLSRDSSSWEVSTFNTLFTAAELLDPYRLDFAPKRTVYEWNLHWDLELGWRQGS